MPNWCNNSVTFNGPRKVIEELSREEFTFGRFFPCPKELTETQSPAAKDIADKNIAKYGHPDWYSWNIANWGTKWDVDVNMDQMIYITEKNCYITMTFDSAWAPPVEFFKKLFEKYKDQGLNIEMEYFESGCCFLGSCVTVKGIFYDDYREYTDMESLRAAIKELDHSLDKYDLEWMEETAFDEQKLLDEENKPVTVKKPVKKAVKKKATKKVAKKKAVKKKS
jgi:hypothetical protein